MVAAVVAPEAATAQAPQKATPERPNIVFILADDLGYNDLSCYGNEYIKTPNIDKLAATGTRFEQAYAGSGISSPSRCSLMTGKSSGHGRIRDNQCPVGGLRGMKIQVNGDTTYNHRVNLLPEDTTIATVLSAGGYRTCLVNKWHLDGYDPSASPNHRGFDEFYGWTISTPISNGPYYYYPAYRFHGDSLIHVTENAGDAHVRHNTELSTDDAIAFITREKDHPFFLYLAYDAPHEPYHIDDTSWYDEQTWDANTKRYAALVTHMDYNIGRLLGALDALGLRDNTLVIFASDNGAAKVAPLKTLRCGGNLKGHKGQLYEGGIRVPLIVNQPGRVPVRSVRNIVYFPDFMPTLAAITGSSSHLPQHTDGMDVSALFYGGTADTDSRYLYWEFPGKQHAIRLGKWKAESIGNKPMELYDIDADPNETTDLSAKEPKLLKRLVNKMKSMRTPTPNWPDKEYDSPTPKPLPIKGRGARLHR